MPSLTLKNGTTEDSQEVEVILMALAELGAFTLMYLKEVVNNEMMASSLQPAIKNNLKEVGLLQSDDKIHPTIRNVVQSALKYEGGKLLIDDPVFRQSQAAGVAGAANAHSVSIQSSAARSGQSSAPSAPATQQYRTQTPAPRRH